MIVSKTQKLDLHWKISREWLIAEWYYWLYDILIGLIKINGNQLQHDSYIVHHASWKIKDKKNTGKTKRKKIKEKSNKFNYKRKGTMNKKLEIKKRGKTKKAKKRKRNKYREFKSKGQRYWGFITIKCVFHLG